MLPPPKSGMPAWLLVLLVAGGLIGAGYAFLSMRESGGSHSAAGTEEAKGPAKGVVKSGDHPYSKVIEVSGLRVSESADKKLDVRMLVVNHSVGDLQEFKLQVDLVIANAKAGSPPISTFTVRVPGLPPLGSRDVKTTAATQLRAYEFPDWQFLRADFTILGQ